MLSTAYQKALQALKDQAIAVTKHLGEKNWAAGVLALSDAQTRMALYPDECQHIIRVLMRSNNKDMTVMTIDEDTLELALFNGREDDVTPPKKEEITIGGLDICNDADAPLGFIFPTDQATSYLLDGHVCKAMVMALDASAGLQKLPSIGSTDVSFNYAQAATALSIVRDNALLGEESIAGLEEVFARWKSVPHSEAIIWWNRAPYTFDLPMAVGASGLKGGATPLYLMASAEEVTEATDQEFDFYRIK